MARSEHCANAGLGKIKNQTELNCAIRRTRMRFLCCPRLFTRAGFCAVWSRSSDAPRVSGGNATNLVE